MSPPPVPNPPSSAFAAYRRGLQATYEELRRLYAIVGAEDEVRRTR